jgi:hypothetical protein
VAVWLK